MRKLNNSMLQGNVLSSIITYTIPIILTSVLQLLFNAADLVVVGRFCGSISVGAVGATGSIINLIVNLFIGISNGVSVTVAHAIGGKQEEATRRTVHTVLPIALMGGIFLTFIGVAFSGTFLRWMDTPESVLPLSTVYMRIYFVGITFTLVYNFCASILRAAGDSKSPLIFLTIAGIINVLLNLLFVTLFHMNVAGVALATVISQGISAVLVVIMLMHRTDACRLVISKLKIYKVQFLKIIRLGLPAGIQGSLFAISNVIIQSSINSFGDIVVAGNAAAVNLDGFVYVAVNGFYQSAVNFIGQNAGAGQYDRVKRIFLTCLGCATVTGVVFGISAFVFGEPLLSIYITDSQEAIRYGMIRMAYVCIPYFLCGLMDTAVGGLRGLGASFVPMVVSVLGVCGIRLGWIFTVFRIPEFHTLESLYLSYPVSWIATFIMQLTAFFIVYRKHRKPSTQKLSAARS